MDKKSVYRGVYDLHEQSLTHLKEPDFWDGFFWPRANTLAEKHGQDEFFCDMLTAVHGDLERRWAALQRAQGPPTQRTA